MCVHASIFKVVTHHTCATALDNLNTVYKKVMGIKGAQERAPEWNPEGDLKGDSKGDPEGDPKEDPKGDPKGDLRKHFNMMK